MGLASLTTNNSCYYLIYILSHGFQVTRQVEKENISLCSRLLFPHGIGPWGLTLNKKWNLALTYWHMGPKLNSPNISHSTGRILERNQTYSTVWCLLCFTWYGIIAKCFRRLRGYGTFMADLCSLTSCSNVVEERFVGKQDLC